MDTLIIAIVAAVSFVMLLNTRLWSKYCIENELGIVVYMAPYILSLLALTLSVVTKIIY